MVGERKNHDGMMVRILVGVAAFTCARVQVSPFICEVLGIEEEDEVLGNTRGCFVICSK